MENKRNILSTSEINSNRNRDIKNEDHIKNYYIAQITSSNKSENYGHSKNLNQSPKIESGTFRENNQNKSKIKTFN